MRTQPVHRVVLEFHLLFREYLVDEPVAGAAEIRESRAHILPVEQLLIAFVTVASSRDQMMACNIDALAAAQLARPRGHLN